MAVVAIIGCDKKSEALKRGLIRSGHQAKMVGIGSDLNCFDAVVITGLADFESIREKCEGKVVIAPFDKDGVINYLKIQSFKVANAVPSAEGALHTLMGKAERTVAGMKIAVLGSGCIASRLKIILDGVGAKVTVFARNGKGDRHISSLCGFECDAVINTVPALLLTEGVLYSFPEKPIVIDLASKPGGTDFEAAKRLGITCVHDLAIPGRYSPVSAGEIIADTVVSILRQKGYGD